MAIFILPPQVRDQIAAGEVVERPASLVKELIENSLDAQAKRIDVAIWEGGKKKIEISDDGVGMSRDDAEKSILRHATSKISGIDDLFRLQTFGFRGEALAAISAVSRFELITKREEDFVGTRLFVEGEMKDVSPVPANTGTMIRVSDLFFNVPVRKEYLKSSETEFRALWKEFLGFVLARFDVSFSFSKDDKLIASWEAVSSLEKRLQQVVPSLFSSLIPFSFDKKHFRAYGFISAPGQGLANRHSQYVFVNGRRIEDYKVALALREGMAQTTGIEKHLYPAFFLFLDIDPVLVDVNVHPRKTEVKWSDPQELFSFLKRGIEHVFLEAGKQRLETFFPRSEKSFSALLSTSSSSFGSSSSPAFSFRKPPEVFEKKSFFDETFSLASSRSIFRLIGQVANSYILAETDTGVYVFDQHALHERQRFEQFWNQYQSQPRAVQTLLVPQTFSFDATLISFFCEQVQEIVSLGFDLEIFSDSEIFLKSVPALLADQNLEDLLLQFPVFFEQEKLSESFDVAFMRKLLEYKSCRGAVMFGDSLSSVEMQKLLDSFEQTKFPDLCPHGRPSFFFLSFEDFHKNFHRYV